ncbi:MAG: hypothetical protein R2736_23270 [Solirubrobacterales bacterium]
MLAERGHDPQLVRVTRVLGRIDVLALLHEGDLALGTFDVALVRGILAGSLSR